MIVTGCTTSGCVAPPRWTLLYHRHHRPRGVCRRQGEPHLASLFDLDAKYGDVVDAKEVVEYLNRLG